MEVSPPRWNAIDSIAVTLSGMVKEVSESVYIKAAPPMLVTLFGMEIELSDLAPMNA
jgi:hypothetical protein